MIPIRYTEQEFNELIEKGYFGDPIDYIEENARKIPYKLALVDSKSRLTFLQIKQKSDRLALNLLKLGFHKDDIIIVQLPNVVEWIVVQSALYKAGIIGLYIMQYFRHKELEFCCSQTQASGHIITAEFAGFNYFQMSNEIQQKYPYMRHILVVGNNVPSGALSINEMMETPSKISDVSYLQQTKINWGEIHQLRVTSGTTGMPKLVECPLTRSRLEDTIKTRYKVTHNDVFAALAPLSGGPSGVPCRGQGIAQREGCTVALLEKFDAEKAVKLIEKEKVTFATGVPAMLTMINNLPDINKYNLTSLRAFEVAGASLPYNVAKTFEEKLPNCKIINRLGSVDVGFASTSCVNDPPEIRWGSVGKPITDITIKLIDEHDREVVEGEVGEIVYAKINGTDRSYFRDIKATLDREKDGLARTGDLGKFDPQGNLYIVGRKKDVIIRGGQNIFPAEIESLLIMHPDIKDVAIVGIPDRVMGEKACAFVICKPEKQFTFEKMVSFLLGKKVAKYKLPERLELVNVFPMSGDGQKVMKRKLTEEIIAKLIAEGIIEKEK